MTEQRVSDLEIEHDMRFVQRSWTVQRVGRIIWLLLIMAAMLGAFGHGWLGSDRATTSDGKLSVQYQRIVHLQAPDRMEISVAPGVAGDGVLRLWIDRHYVGDGTLRMISPDPIHLETVAERIIYTFGASN